MLRKTNSDGSVYRTELDTYDVFNRLVKTENKNGLITYKYTPSGLRLSKTANGNTTTHVWDGDQMVLGLDNNGGVANRYVRGINLIKNQYNQYYLFNAHGDVVQLTDSNGNVIRNYNYDAFGNEVNGEYLLEGSAYVSISENNLPNKISYTPTWIDPQLSIKIGQITDSKVAITLKITANEDSQGQIFWCTESGNYSEGNSKVFAVKSGTREYTIDLGNISLYRVRIDVGVQGSPVTLSNIQLNVNVDEDSNVFRYSGEYFDKETGTIYLRARYYDPFTGRFMNEDPVRDGLNYYTYCGNNPIFFFDPSGLQAYEYRADRATVGGSSNYPQYALPSIVPPATAHDILDALGMFPALGGVFDGANGLYYIIQGDEANAVISMMGIMPGGQVATGARLLTKGGKEAVELTSSLKKVDGIVEGAGSAKGLIGKDFEDFLTKQLGGNGSFSKMGRDFDGGIGDKWWEAKSGQYWDMIMKDQAKIVKFKSDMGARLKIAKDKGATYELYSNTPIPEAIKDWLTQKGMPYTEFLD